MGRTNARETGPQPLSGWLTFEGDQEAEERRNDHHREERRIVDGEHRVSTGDGRRRRVPAPGT